MTTTVDDLLRRKGNEVISVHADSTVFEAIEVMESRRVGSVVVVGTKEHSGETLGIFTERDYLRRIVLQGRTSKNTLVREAMTTDLITIGPDATLSDCMALMTEHRIRHLPVVAVGKVIGLLSIGDVVKAVLAATQAKAEALEELVTGTYPG